MAEPFSPEAYLAIAATVHNAVNSHRAKRALPNQQNDRTATTVASKATTASPPTDELLSYAGLKTGNDGYVQLIADGPTHPRNWSRRRKAYDFGLILFLEFFMSGIGAAGTLASVEGGEMLGRSSREVGFVAFMTMYLLGQALGTLLLSPYSDRFGRRTLYVGSAFLFSVFCLPVAATSNIAGVFVGRFVSGVIAAIPAVTTRRSIDDLFFGGESRMWAFSSWALVTNLGLVLGPVYASFVTESLNWRWPFYLASIIVAVTGMLMYFIRESHTPVLLERTVAAIRSHRPDLNLRTAPTALRPSVFRPLILFFTNPTILLAALANAFATALLYLFAVAFPLIYAHYAWSGRKTTLIFLFIALGLSFSIFNRFHDRHAIRKSHLTNHPLTPEKTLLGLAVGAPALAVGLWWFAWTTPGSHIQTLPWPASALSLVLVGYGINEYSTTLPRYVLESYPQRSSNDDDASSTFVALLLPRALLGAAFPLFTEQMLQHLGNNVAGSVLAAVATAFCLLLFLVMRFGHGSRWRLGTGDSVDSDGEDASKVVVVEEEAKEKKPKPKKTVRFWDDEEVSVLEESKSGSSGGADLSSGFSSSETIVESSTISADDDDDDADSVDEDAQASVAAVKEGEIKRTATVASMSTGGGGDTGGNQQEKTKTKTENEKRESSRIDDGSQGYVSFLGMGLDVERLVGFPYIVGWGKNIGAEEWNGMGGLNAAFVDLADDGYLDERVLVRFLF